MMFGMWAAVLPAIMDPGNEIAVTSGLFGLGYGQISNPNLYFFSWGATLISLYIMVSFLREKFGREDTKDFHLGHWAMLVGTSFVVMANASRQFKDLNCDDRDTIQCDRTEFATGLGAASALFGFLMMGYGSFCAVPAMIDGLVTFLFLAAWVVGITLITFGGSKAAAPFLGNLYFFTWASFGLTARMFSSDVFKTLDGFMTTDDQVQGEEEKKMEEGEKEKEGDEEAAE